MLTKATWVQTTLYTENHHQYIKSTKVSKPSMSYEFKPNINIMSLNQTLTITTVYQTHNNNNYPKHNTITIHINKVNKINIVFDCSPLNWYSPSRAASQKLLPLFDRNGQRVTASVCIQNNQYSVSVIKK